MGISNLEWRGIARRFGIRVKRHRRIYDGAYRIQLADGGQFVLKSMPYSLAQLRWMDGALQEIRKAGFTRISWRNPAEREGKRLYVRLRGLPYILTPWIEGRWPSPKSPDEMKACGAMLADFHKSSTGSFARSSRVDMIGKWPAELRRKHATLRRQIRISRQSQPTNRVRLFLQSHGQELLRYSRQAQAILRTNQYRQACALARQRPYICHGDGGPTNFILNRGGLHLIDFETMRVDLRAYDLYRVIYNSCKDHGWDFRVARALLDGYQTVSPLCVTDLDLVRVWLRFPRTTVLLLNAYFRSKDPQERLKLAAGLPGAVKVERRMTGFLKELERYLD